MLTKSIFEAKNIFVVRGLFLIIAYRIAEKLARFFPRAFSLQSSMMQVQNDAPLYGRAVLLMAMLIVNNATEVKPARNEDAAAAVIPKKHAFVDRLGRPLN